MKKDLALHNRFLVLDTIDWNQTGRDFLKNFIFTESFNSWSGGQIQIGKYLKKNEISPHITILSNFWRKVCIWRNPPATNTKVHTDRGRSCALNFPISSDGMLCVAKAESAWYFEKNRSVIYDFRTPEGQTPYVESWPNYSSETADHYNCIDVNCPILLDTKTPHCGINADKHNFRYILTITFNGTYDEVINEYFKEYTSES